MELTLLTGVWVTVSMVDLAAPLICHMVVWTEEGCSPTPIPTQRCL